MQGGGFGSVCFLAFLLSGVTSEKLLNSQDLELDGDGDSHDNSSEEVKAGTSRELRTAKFSELDDVESLEERSANSFARATATSGLGNGAYSQAGSVSNSYTSGFATAEANALAQASSSTQTQAEAIANARTYNSGNFMKPVFPRAYANVLKAGRSRVIPQQEYIWPDEIPGSESLVCSREGELHNYMSPLYECLLCACINQNGFLRPVCARCGCDASPPEPQPLPQPEPTLIPVPELPPKSVPITQVSCDPLPTETPFENPLNPCQICVCHSTIDGLGRPEAKIDCQENPACLIQPDIIVPIPSKQWPPTPIPMPHCKYFPENVLFPHPNDECSLCQCLVSTVSGIPQDVMICYPKEDCGEPQPLPTIPIVPFNPPSQEVIPLIPDPVPEPLPLPQNLPQPYIIPDNQLQPIPEPYIIPDKQPQPIPQPYIIPDNQPQPIPQPYIIPDNQPQPILQPYIIPDNQSQPIPQPNIIPDNQPQPIPQPYIIPDNQPQPIPQPYIIPENQPQPLPQPYIIPDNQPQPIPQPYIIPDNQPQPIPQPYINPDNPPQPIPQPYILPDNKPQPIPQPYIIPDNQPQPIPQPYINPDNQPQPIPQPYIIPDNQPQPIPEPYIIPDNQPQPMPEPYIIPDTKPQPLPEPFPSPEPIPLPPPEIYPLINPVPIPPAPIKPLPPPGPLPGPPPHKSCRPYTSNQPFAHPWDECQECVCTELYAPGVINIEVYCYAKKECCIMSPPQPRPPPLPPTPIEVILNIGKKQPRVIDPVCEYRGTGVSFPHPQNPCRICTCEIFDNIVAPVCSLSNGPECNKQLVPYGNVVYIEPRCRFRLPLQPFVTDCNVCTCRLVFTYVIASCNRQPSCSTPEGLGTWSSADAYANAQSNSLSTNNVRPLILPYSGLPLYMNPQTNPGSSKLFPLRQLSGSSTAVAEAQAQTTSNLNSLGVSPFSGVDQGYFPGSSSSSSGAEANANANSGYSTLGSGSRYQSESSASALANAFSNLGLSPLRAQSLPNIGSSFGNMGNTIGLSGSSGSSASAEANAEAISGTSQSSAAHAEAEANYGSQVASSAVSTAYTSGSAPLLPVGSNLWNDANTNNALSGSSAAASAEAHSQANAGYNQSPNTNFGYIPNSGLGNNFGYNAYLTGLASPGANNGHNPLRSPYNMGSTGTSQATAVAHADATAQAKVVNNQQLQYPNQFLASSPSSSQSMANALAEASSNANFYSYANSPYNSLQSYTPGNSLRTNSEAEALANAGGFGYSDQSGSGSMGHSQALAQSTAVGFGQASAQNQSLASAATGRTVIKSGPGMCKYVGDKYHHNCQACFCERDEDGKLSAVCLGTPCA